MSEVQILILPVAIGWASPRVTSYLFDKGGNVLEAQQFDDLAGGEFFMRIAFDPGAADPEALRAGFLDLAGTYGTVGHCATATVRARSYCLSANSIIAWPTYSIAAV